MRTKISKARAFIDMASVSDEELPDVTVSLAASAAINASDALCLLRGLPVPRSEDHTTATSILRGLGLATAARHLAGAIANKSKAQYSDHKCTAVEARLALQHAERILTQAEAEAGAKGVLSE